MEPSKVTVKGTDQKMRTVDGRGRTLVLRRPTALDALRLFKAAGPTLSQNDSWLAMASLAYAVEEIDNVPMPCPANESQIEAQVDRLGEDGLAAVAAAISLVENKAELQATVGNLPGTPC